MMLYTNEHWLQDDWDNFKGTLKTVLKPQCDLLRKTVRKE
jgi:hypothetical protein